MPAVELLRLYIFRLISRGKTLLLPRLVESSPFRLVFVCTSS